MADVSRRGFALGVAASAVGIPILAHAQALPTGAPEIKLGQTQPYSGPASAYGAVGRAEVAYFQMVNDQGGVAGHRVNLISLDDGYSPPKTVEATRRLVEQDQVIAIFASLGTAPNSATARVPQPKGRARSVHQQRRQQMGRLQAVPLLHGRAADYRIEGQIYAKYILQQNPVAKIAILWQNDDLGKDYISGLRDVLSERFEKVVVGSASYEVTDATIDSQVVILKGSGADALIIAATPKFAALAIRKVYDIDWKPMSFLTNAAASVTAVLQPAGVEKAVGLMTAAYAKDNNDAIWKNDPGMNQYRAMMAKYLPSSEAGDAAYVTGFGWAFMMHQVLKQCGTDFSRENLMRQANSMHDLEVPVWLPGIRINTSLTQHNPMTQLQLQRWNGSNWELFGQLIQGSGA